MPAITPARLLRYTEFLSNFEYEMLLKKGSQQENANLKKKKSSTDKIINEEVNQLCVSFVFEISNEPLNAWIFATKIAEDTDLSLLMTNLISSKESNDNFNCNIHIRHYKDEAAYKEILLLERHR